MTIARIDQRLCTGCRRCVEICPMDVLREAEGGRPAIRYREDCQCCYLCALECPAGAVEVDPWRAFAPGNVYGVFGQSPEQES